MKWITKGKLENEQVTCYSRFYSPDYRTMSLRNKNKTLYFLIGFLKKEKKSKSSSIYNSLIH